MQKNTVSKLNIQAALYKKQQNIVTKYKAAHKHCAAQGQG